MSLSSPFEGVYERVGARFAEYEGWRLPKDFGDPAAERSALATGAAAFDLSSFGRIAVKGAGAESLIAFLVGPGHEPFADGRWRRMAAAADTAPLRIGALKGGFLVLTLPGQRPGILERIQTGAAGDISVADMTEKTGMLGIYGPRSFDAVSRILPFDLSDLTPGSIRAMSFFMMAVTIIRGAWAECDGVELICPASAAPMAAGAVAKYQQRENILPAGMDCLVEAIRSA